MKPNEIIFWNVDTEEDFMSPDGKLYVKNAEKIEPALRYLTGFAFKHEIRVVSTGDLHDEDSRELSETPDFAATFPKHCMRNTKGADFVEATRSGYAYEIDWKAEKFSQRKVREYRCITLYKDDFDIFKGNPHADAVLKVLNPKAAVVFGVTTNVCVDYAVMGLISRGVKVYVVGDAIKELPNLPVDEVYTKWSRNGVIMTDTEGLERVLREA